MIGFKFKILVWLLVRSEESWVRHVYIMAGLGKKIKRERCLVSQLDGGAIVFQFGS